MLYEDVQNGIYIAGHWPLDKPAQQKIRVPGRQLCRQAWARSSAQRSTEETGLKQQVCTKCRSMVLSLPLLTPTFSGALECH